MSRRQREELRSLLIDAGCELLRARGLALDPPHLTYANVFKHLEQTQGIRLHRSQVHGRIWASQDHYRIDVAINTIAYAAPGSAEVDELVRELQAPEQPTTVRAVAEAWIAASADASREKASLDLRYELLVAAQALSASGTATAQDIADAARNNLHQRTKHNEHRYQAVTERLGVSVTEALDLNPEDAYSILARTSSALLEGARLLESVDELSAAPFHITDGANTPQVRDMAALGLSLIVEQLFGLDGNTSEPPTA